MGLAEPFFGAGSEQFFLALKQKQRRNIFQTRRKQIEPGLSAFFLFYFNFYHHYSGLNFKMGQRGQLEARCVPRRVTRLVVNHINWLFSMLRFYGSHYSPPFFLWIFHSPTLALDNLFLLNS